MAILKRTEVLAAETESVKGTAETLVDADAFFAEDVSWPYSPTQIERPRSRLTLSKDPSLVTQKIASVSFAVEIKGSGTATTPPVWGRLLQACGCSQTVGTSSVTWAPTTLSDNVATLTIRRYITEGAVSFVETLYGARGNVVFEFAAGEISKMRFTFTGKYLKRVALAALTATDHATLPPIYENATMSIHSYAAAVFSRFTLDFGNTVSMRSNANATDGLAYAEITDRNVTGTLDIDTTIPATFDPDTLLEGTTTGSVSSTLGAAAGNRVVVTCPKVQIVARGDAERDGIAVDELTLRMCINSTGDDEFSIQHN